ncbi:MAG: type II toxin-antitoxin system HicB family antitoxin [Fimbriimonadaceae bacterium]|nr:type II toxin-antitoxin system HicB family antitoxin [Fimbriimonadaceae bacterium]
MRKATWRVVLEQDPASGDWAAWCPELPGCCSAGGTRQGALDGIREAIALYLQPDPVELGPAAELVEVAV